MTAASRAVHCPQGMNHRAGSISYLCANRIWKLENHLLPSRRPRDDGTSQGEPEASRSWFVAAAAAAVATTQERERKREGEREK